jgi:hypothetical protein
LLLVLPHLLLSFTVVNQALEGLVKQVLPVRVALQLRESAAQQQQQQQAQIPAALASPGSSIGLTAAAGVTHNALGADNSSSSRQPAGQHTQGAGDSSGAGSSAAAAAASQPQLQQGTDVADGAAENNDSNWSQQPPRWQRQRQLRSRNPLLQHQLQQQQQVPSVHQTAPQDGAAPGAMQQQQVLQQQAAPDSSSALGPLLTFKQPQLEHAYRVSTCRQWQQRLDILFLMLSLMSAVGGRLGSFLKATGSAGVAGSLLLVMACVLWALLQQLLAMAVPRYLKLRGPVIAASRLLRVLLFCLEAQQLPAQVLVRPVIVVAAAAAGDSMSASSSWRLLLQQLHCWSPVEVAGCGIVVMQGLSGQLPVALHAAVQAVAVAALLGSLSLLTIDRHGAAAVAPVCVLVGQVLVGWVVPVLVVALTEWHMRNAFLRRIR